MDSNNINTENFEVILASRNTMNLLQKLLNKLEYLSKATDKELLFAQSNWISAENKLPEEDKNVLVCYKCLCDKGYNCTYKNVGIGYCSLFGWYVKGVGAAVEVLAWMPLPKIYEESEVSG